MKLRKRVRMRQLPEEKFLKAWPCYLANVDVISRSGVPTADLAKYNAAEDWVLENIDYDSVMRFGRTFYFKNKQDQIDFILRWG